MGGKVLQRRGHGPRTQLAETSAEKVKEAVTQEGLVHSLNERGKDAKSKTIASFSYLEERLKGRLKEGRFGLSDSVEGRR